MCRIAQFGHSARLVQAPRFARSSSRYLTKGRSLCQDVGQSLAGCSPEDIRPSPRLPRPASAPATTRRGVAATLTFPSKATHQQTRAHNAALVLRALFDFGPISRADVARLSGLTRTTVGDVIGKLSDDGLAREIGRGPSTGGKAPSLLELID